MSHKLEAHNNASANVAEELYFVVINIEEQYSIWPIHKSVPFGWKTLGEPQSKTACLEYIKEVWIDMRPLSLRKNDELKK